MKKFFSLTILIVSFNVSFSAPVITTTSTGNWTNSSGWNLNRLPQIGDTIVVSSGNTITVSSDITVNGEVYIKIYGTVKFQNNSTTVTLGSPSTVVVYSGGQIIGASASEKLRIGGNVVYQGNTTVVGPLVANLTTPGFVSFSSIALPVKFLGFNVVRKSNDVLVQWSTREEMNANLFQVEKSTDGINWNAIATVSAAGNASSIHNYSYTDKNNTAKTTYYRIKEVDFDGRTALTAVRSIKSETIDNEIKIASSQSKVLLQFSQEIKGNVVIRFVSQNGQVTDQQNISNPFGQIVLNSKVTGNYIISISNGQNINTSKQVIL